MVPSCAKENQEKQKIPAADTAAGYKFAGQLLVSALMSCVPTNGEQDAPYKSENHKESSTSRREARAGR